MQYAIMAMHYVATTIISDNTKDTANYWAATTTINENTKDTGNYWAKISYSMF